MNRFESHTEESTEAPSKPLGEKGKLIVSGRKGNLIILSGKHETSDSSFVAPQRTNEIHPLKNLNLSENGVENIRRILQKNGGSLEKTSEKLGAPLYWIKIVVEKYKLG